MRRARRLSQRGVSAVVTAAAMLLLVGMAAIAVDVSGFYEQASSQQRAADLACLAGVVELPQDPATAVTMAASFLGPNHVKLRGLNPSSPTSGTVGPGITTYAFNNHAVQIETPFNGSAAKMRVTIAQSAATDFAKIWGTQQVQILENAVCEVGSGIAGADMPWGMLTGFTGGILNYGQNQCTLNGQSTSQCSGLAIPRQNQPAGSQYVITTSNNYIANMVSGLNWGLGPVGPGSPEILCPMNGQPQPGDPNPCNRVATISGDDPSKIYRGLISGFSNNQYPGSQIGYLEHLHGNNASLSFGGDVYDGHDMPDVLECDANNDGTGSSGECTTAVASLGWTNSTAHPVVKVTRVKDCLCRRLARVPIVSNFPTNAGNCGSYDPNDPTQLNSCSARITGFQWIWILRPYFNGTVDANGDGVIDNDFNNSGSGNQVRTIAAVALDFTNAKVDGDCFSAYKEGAPKKVRLTAT